MKKASLIVAIGITLLVVFSYGIVTKIGNDMSRKNVLKTWMGVSAQMFFQIYPPADGSAIVVCDRDITCWAVQYDRIDVRSTGTFYYIGSNMIGYVTPILHSTWADTDFIRHNGTKLQ